MPNNINQLANVIMRESEGYDLNFLVVEVGGIRRSKTRVDTAEQIEQHIERIVAELNIQGTITYQEDEAIEFAWYVENEQGKEVNLYMI